MSTTIFTFDHGQKKLHNAIGVKEEYLDELGKQVSNLIRGLKCDEEKEELNDVAPSEIVQSLAENLSYSQLVLLSSFYIRDKIEEMETMAAKKFIKQSILSVDSDDIPQELKDILDKLRNRKTDDESED